VPGWAAAVTGLEFSGASPAEARPRTAAAGAGIDFREANVHDTVEVLGAGHRLAVGYTLQAVRHG
jgi:hypothetical protein